MTHDHYPYADSIGCPICEASARRLATLTEAEHKDAADANYQLGYAIGLLRHALRRIEGTDRFPEQTENDIREFLAKYPRIGK